MVTRNDDNGKKNPPRMVGVTLVARKYGVSRQHLWQVAHGLRKSQKLAGAVAELRIINGITGGQA